MKVLHLNESIKVTGGTEIYILDLIKCLEKDGVKSDFYAVNRNKSIRELFKFVDGKSQSIGTFQNVSSLINYFKKESFSHVHIHGLSDRSLISALGAVFPLFRSMHEPRMICPGRAKFLFKSENICTKPFSVSCLSSAYLQKCASRNPLSLLDAYSNTKHEIEFSRKVYQKVFVMSEYMKSEAIRVGIPENKLVYNPYFTSMKGKGNRANSGDQIRFLFVGRFIRHKGIHVLLDYIAEILNENKNVFLDIVGDGFGRASLEEQVRELRIEAKVDFHGWKNHDEVVDFYQNCYAVVFPSIYPEAFGIIGLEAMAYGKPVIAFNVGGISTWLNDGQNGFLIELGDKEAFVKSLAVLINDKHVYQRMSEASRGHLEHFSSGKHMAVVMNTYLSGLSEKNE